MCWKSPKLKTIADAIIFDALVICSSKLTCQVKAIDSSQHRYNDSKHNLLKIHFKNTYLIPKTRHQLISEIILGTCAFQHRLKFKFNVSQVETD